MPVGKVRPVLKIDNKRQSPLDYWLEQERDNGPDEDLSADREERVLSGWWVLPSVALGLPIWAMIIWAIVLA